MSAVHQEILSVFNWLIESSFQATVLLALILLVRGLVRNWFQVRMIYWFWILLLLRLIWPLNLQTTVSIFNLVPSGTDFVLTAEEAADNRDDSNRLSGGGQAGVEPSADEAASAAPATLAELPHSIGKRFGWLPWLCTLWLTGAGLLTAWVMLSNWRLWRIIKRERLVTRQPILELLEDCKARLNLQTVIGVVETDSVSAPCLFGYLRPRLLLPAGALEELTQQQLHYVFIHELAHLKRHDILIGWLMAAVQVLHWFNPAVWFAMSRINSDRELACDELALSHLGESESQSYGQTILMFLERFARKQKLPAMAGIAENQTLLKRRMTMIAKFENRRVSWIPAAALMAALICATFTSAAEDPNQPAGLNEAQAVYRDWTNKTFGALEDSQYATLSDAAKIEMEQIWLSELKKGKGGGYTDAINALGAIRSQQAFMPLAKIAFDPAEKGNRDRWMAVRALGYIGDERAVPKMIHLVYHYNMNTRFWAQISLFNLTGQNFGTDWRAWGQWWNEQGKKPGFNAAYIRWTNNKEWADLEQQKAADAAFIAQCKGEDNAPRVVETSPQAMTIDVRPGRQTISVTFDQPMTDQSWSWTGGGETYPEILGRPHYSEDRKTCTVEVMLEPGKVYWVGINSPSHKNFKSAGGVPAKRYVILFATQDATGYPTPIPDDMLQQAAQINEGHKQAP